MNARAGATLPGRDIVIFDLGGVLLDWDPRNLYRRFFGADVAAMEQFLATVCTPEWNEKQDAGRSFAEAECRDCGLGRLATAPDGIPFFDVAFRSALARGTLLH